MAGSPQQQQPGQQFAARIPQIIPKVATIAVPAPTGGWNARDSIDAMDPTDAVSIVNLFPTFGKVSRRNGYQAWATGLGGPVQTITEYNAARTRKMLAAANGKIFDVSATGAVGAALATGFSSNKWCTATFQNAAGIANQVWVNGVDAPQNFDGTSITAATISGSSLTVTNLVGATVFKDRVFYWENASQILWYSAIGAISGVLTAFNLGGLSGFGGNIAFIGTWSFNGGAGPQDYCVIAMTSGDLLVYQGTDISTAANWSIVGIFHIGSPVSDAQAQGPRAYAKFGPDLAVICKDGFIPLSQVLPALFTPATALSNKITFAAQTAVNAYHENFGWQILLYPLGNMAIFNVPISTLAYVQYVMNTATGSWTQFNNLNAICWTLFKDDPYFGGTDGNTYLFNGNSTVGQINLDNGGPIMIAAQTAWNYFGDRTRLKRLNLLRPAISSSESITLGLAVGADFNTPVVPTPNTTFATMGSPWNTSPWNTSPWGGLSKTFIPRLIKNAVGNCFSTVVAASLSDTVFDWLSLTYQYEPGEGI